MSTFQTKYSGDRFWSELVTHGPVTGGNNVLHAIPLVLDNFSNEKQYHLTKGVEFWVTWTMPSSHSGLVFVIDDGIVLNGVDFDASLVVCYDGTEDSLNVLALSGKGVGHNSDEGGYHSWFTTGSRTFNMSTQYWLKLVAPATGNFTMSISVD